MISEWNVTLPRHLTKQIEQEVISQNINLRTAVIEAFALWMKAPPTTRKNLIEPELDLGQGTPFEVGNDKQCIFVDRSCLKNTCVGWHNDNCFIYLFKYPIVKEIMTEKAMDSTSIISGDFPSEGADLDEILKTVERTII